MDQELAKCLPLLGRLSASVEAVGSEQTRNELIVSLLSQAGALQSTVPDADIVIDDASFSVSGHDLQDREAAATVFVRPDATWYPKRQNFSSRVYFVLADLIQEGLVFYAHPIWSRELRPAFLTRLTARGLQLLRDPQELHRQYPVPSANRCFVIMSFSDDKRLIDFYRFGIHLAVQKCGFECVRVDEVEHNRRITDEVLQQIEAARFVVADLTEARPNCYYELGWAHRAGKEVIPTIHVSTPIHFDVKDYNFIIYETASDLCDRLEERIRLTVGIDSSLIAQHNMPLQPTARGSSVRRG
jgi:hypothetical protein